MSKSKKTFQNNKNAQQDKVVAPPTDVKSTAKKEKQKSTVSRNEQLFWTIAFLLVFVGIALYELIVNNSDMLFKAQGRSLFVYGSEFFSTLTKSPGYIGAWVGAYLTQFFYHPALGSTILVAFWCVIFLLTKRAFKISNARAVLALIPVVCLLISVIDTGYWLYYLKHPGYWFRETIGFLFTIISFYLGTRLNKNIIVQSVYVILLTFFGYMFFGWYASLATIYIVIYEWLTAPSTKQSKLILTFVSALCLIATPLICYNLFFTELRIEDAWLGGFPFFVQDANKGFKPEIPFIVMAIVPMFFPLNTKYLDNVKLEGTNALVYRLLNIVLLVGIPFVIDKANFDDYNYHAEMRMYHATKECRWDDVLEESANYQSTPTREMVILNHIALFNTGKVGTKMFSYNNFGKAPHVYDSLKVHMVQTAGPVIYYHHGKTNFAIRWCVENGVEFGNNFDELQVLVNCALVNGEWEVAKKYLEILHNSIYYKEWAEKYLPIVHKPSLIKNYHEFDNVRELYNHMGSILDGDNGLCEMYLINYFSNTMNKDSKYLQEITLMYSLIQKDIQLFWPRFFLYAQMHKNEEMPVIYQQAAMLYGNLEQNVDISHMPFSKGIADTYASFQQVSQTYLRQGMSVEQVAAAMRPDFGDTFYWFYFFCRDVKSY